MARRNVPDAIAADEGVTAGVADALRGPIAPSVINPALARWAVDSKRQVLHDHIVQRVSPRIGAFYLEALRSLREGDADVRIPVAGHMLRELQDGLRKEMNVERVQGGANAFWEFVRDQWAMVITKRPAAPGKWLWADELIDKALGRFLARLHQEVQRMNVLRPKQRDQHTGLLGEMDPGFARAPEKVRMDQVEIWMGFWDTFNTATHAADPDEFEDKVERFEDFLRDRLIPQTFEKQAAIADFIRGVESSA
jgi:hypothetical protein